jgi:acyl-[acyl-carrier-protein]-phospholipid O-acyltransferase/long-chain-fatty-acid--[acyl-carrier-protein] ligase
LFNRGLLSLLATQFFGAANDNILKQILIFMVATGLWAERLGAGGQSLIGVTQAIPFILLSGIAGQVADRQSKRSVMIGVKITEIPIAALALLGLWMRSLWVTFAAFALLSIQSSFFGPAKYGVVPELVEDGELSRANGWLNMLTNVAIIAGALIAGPLSDAYYPEASGAASAEPVLWAPGAALLVVAGLGLLAILIMPPLKAGAPDLRYDLNVFKTYWLALKEMAAGPLIVVALAWAFFYMLGSIALLALPEYQEVLEIDYKLTSRIIGLLGIAIGAGSLLAGWLSGHHIRPRLIPVGALGMSLCMILLGVIPPTYLNVNILICGCGVFAGFYIIPLQALLQKLSPPDERGRFLGTTNALSWSFILTGAVVYWLEAQLLGLQSDEVFLVTGLIAAAGSGLALLKLRGMLKQHASV